MNILKIQLPSEHDAINTSDTLTKANVKCVRRGSAVVALSAMYNNYIVVNTTLENKGSIVDASEDDKKVLLGVI